MNDDVNELPPANYHNLDTSFYAGIPRKVLLLEDEPDMSDIVIECLKEQSFEVTIARNGVEGLKHILATDFDVIICDMLMPNLPGDKFYLAVERTKPQLCNRFIFMTAHKTDPRWSDFVQKVSGVMLEKPFHVRDLRLRMEEVLRRSATR